MIDLTGKVALITGSSRGIGRGCALEMARAGADIAVCYRTHPEEAEETAGMIRDLGRRALVVQTEVADRESVDQAVEAACREFGHLDVAVANAAYSKREPFLEMSIESMQRTLDVTLWGVFHTAQAAARKMAERGCGGSLLVISSVHAFLAIPRSLAYNTAKAGINHMTATMAAELVGDRIRVNAIEPGWIDTPGEHKTFTEERLRAAARELPWGRMGTIEDIGRAATFLCSPAADYITGTVLRVDGGFWFREYVDKPADNA